MRSWHPRAPEAKDEHSADPKGGIGECERWKVSLEGVDARAAAASRRNPPDSSTAHALLGWTMVACLPQVCLCAGLAAGDARSCRGAQGVGRSHREADGAERRLSAAPAPRNPPPTAALVAPRLM